jgi:GntR family transcriptional repressor for pyruvate dehydrogenase complex
MVKRAKATLTPAIVPPSEKQSLGTQVVSRILELVRTGNLRPGDRLPPERELIEIFRISRPSLRESLRALSILGVIEIRHGGGAYITYLEARTLLAPLDFFLSLSQSNMDDAFECRRVVEMEIARKAATNANAEDVADLKSMMVAHATVSNDPIGFRILDSQFHERLSVIAGNAILQRIAYGLYNLGLDIRRRATTEAGTITQSTADHARIVDAISTGSADVAAAAMKVHLSHIEASTRRIAASGSSRQPWLRVTRPLQSTK